MTKHRHRQAQATLTEFLGDPLPRDEEAMWLSLSKAQRDRALQRMTALDRWMRSNGAIDVRQAASDAGVKSVTRMYEMGKAWRERRSLTSLGTFAAAPKTRVASYDAEIRRALVAVVATDPDASVRKLALDLQAAVNLASNAMPSHNTFRRYVEDEKRRRKLETMAGRDIMLDCAACTMTPSDEAVMTLFAVMDRGTQVVLGAALGEITDSRRGYAMAARDAQRRFRAGEFARMPWLDGMTRAEIVLGHDIGQWNAFRDELTTAGVTRPVEQSTAESRFGRYFRLLTGLRIGTIVILPKRTDHIDQDAAHAKPTVQGSDRVRRLALEVDAHNSSRLAVIESGCAASPPSDLTRMLELIAGLSPAS